MSNEMLENARIKAMVMSILVHGIGLILLATMTYKVAAKSGDLFPGAIEVSTNSAVAATAIEVLEKPVPVKAAVEKPVVVVKKAKSPTPKKEAKVVPAVLPVKKAAKAEAAPQPVVDDQSAVVVPKVEEKEIEKPEEKEESLTAEAYAPVPVPAPEEDPNLAENTTEESSQAVASDMPENDWTEEAALPAKPMGGSGAASGKPTTNPGLGGQGTSMAGYADGVRSDRELIPVTGNPPGVYPPEARLRKIQGVALVDFDVDRTGRVSNVRLKKSSGSSLLDQEALGTQRKWRYTGGKTGTFRKEFVFRLKGDAQHMPYKIRR